MVDDDSDSNSQCNSAIIKKLHEVGDFDNQCGKLICHFPFEWEKVRSTSVFVAENGK